MPPYNAILTAIRKIKIPRGIIAIDGYDASGKTYFAKKLAQNMSVSGIENRLTSIDDFHFPKDKRHEKGADSAVGFYEDSYDYEAFINKTIKPFKNNAPEICSKIFDLKSDSPEILTMEIPPKCWLIVEGIFLQRTELKHFWDIAVYLKISEIQSLERNLLREFGNEIPEGSREKFQKRYLGGQRIYHAACLPGEADFIIDNSNFTNPKIIKTNV